MFEEAKEGTSITLKSRYQSESDFDQDLKSFLENRLSLAKYKLEIFSKKKIILDTTFYPQSSGDFYFYLNPTECDIVIYRRLSQPPVEKWAEVRDKFPEVIQFYRFAENEIVMQL